MGVAVTRTGTSTFGRALGLLGDSWTLLILQRAFLGVRRFADWRRTLQISDSVLADRLRALTAAGLLETRPYRDGRVRMEYRLTPRGRDLWAFFVAIWSWERAWVPRTGPLPDLMHGGCGRSTDVVFSCGACREPVTARDASITRRPGLTVATALPPRQHPRRTRSALPSDPLSSFRGSLEILGDRWSTAVLAAAMLGVRSFGAFQRELEVSPDVLSDRLRRFVEHDVLASGEGGYRLTDKGRATFPILTCLLGWGDRWLVDDDCAPALTVVHRGCGAALDAVLACRECGETVDRRAVWFDVAAYV